MAIHKLEKGAASDDPAHIFGLPTPSRLSSLFSISKWLKFNPTKQIQRNLQKVVKEANAVIHQAWHPPHPSAGIGFSGLWNDTTLTSRAYFDAHEAGYFTYMPMPCTIPGGSQVWLGDEDAPPDVPIVPVGVDMRVASDAWLEVLAECCEVSNDKQGDEEYEQGVAPDAIAAIDQAEQRSEGAAPDNEPYAIVSGER